MKIRLILAWLIMFVLGMFFMWVFTMSRISALKEEIEVQDELMNKACRQYHFLWEKVK